MSLLANIIILVLSLLIFFAFLCLIKKRKLKKEYSITWFLICLAFILLTVFHGLTDKIVMMIGIDYPPALYFLITIIFLLINLFYVSLEISTLIEQNKTLIQEIALLKFRLDISSKEGTKTPDKTD